MSYAPSLFGGSTPAATPAPITEPSYQVRSLLDLADHPERECSEADRIATRHLAQVEEKIGQLVTLRDELSRIIGRCRGGLAADCRVIEALGDHGICNGEHA